MATMRAGGEIAHNTAPTVAQTATATRGLDGWPGSGVFFMPPREKN